MKAESKLQRLETIREVLSDVITRRSAGEAISDEFVVERHPELLPELAQELRNLRLVQAAAQEAKGVTTVLHVRCPHCLSPVELEADAAVSDVVCSSCRNSFNLISNGANPQFAPGMKVGHFQLVESLGCGAFGTVWSALDTELDRTVAVKIPRNGDLSAEECELFIREARAAAQLKHPHVVSVLEVGRYQNRIYIVSELVVGQDLAAWQEIQQATPREAAELCAVIADALQHAHDQGVIHRDLKPSNVMLDAKGKPHLMDFGLAKRESGEVTMTADGKLLGTPAYMPPEQARGTAHVADARSDVYSLGVMLFELLTGERPFRGSVRMLLQQVLVEDAPSPRTLNGRVPKDLETICLKCLEKSPAQRYQTAAELRDDLKRFLRSEPVEARPITKLARVWRWCRRKPVISALGLSTMGLLVFLAVAGPLVLFVILGMKKVEDELKQIGDFEREVGGAIMLAEVDDRLRFELEERFPSLPLGAFEGRRENLDAWLETANSLLDRLDTHKKNLDASRKISETDVDFTRDEYVSRWVEIRDKAKAARAELEDAIQRGERLKTMKLAKTLRWASRMPSQEAVTARWEEVLKLGEPEFKELPLRSALAQNADLYPLHRNEETRLWEFVDLNTGLLPDPDSPVVDALTGIVYVLLPGGSYTMGSPDNEDERKSDETLHTVSLSPFMISKYEVTQAQWERVMVRNPSRASGQLKPADSLDWEESTEFCKKINARLPTEAQWEYACRAGSTGPFPNNARLDDIGWYGDNSGGTTHHIGLKRANAYGLHDMNGNVMEWCQDYYERDFYKKPEATKLDPVNIPPGEDDRYDRLRGAPDDIALARGSRILRGGGWEGRPEHCRCADRYKEYKAYRYKSFGLRPTRNVH